MKSEIRLVASSFGIFAALASIEHGYFETLQGNTRPAGLLIASIGPPCQPDKVWHLCEPAMTVIPSFFITGVLTIIVGLIVLVWAGTFVHRKHGGFILMILSVLMLLVGGGIFPPVIGFIGGVVGTRIYKAPVWWSTHLSGRPLRLLSKLWPWSLIFFGAWLLGQWIIGYFFNEYLMKSGFFLPILIIGLLLLSVFSAFAHNINSDDAVAEQNKRKV